MPGRRKTLRTLAAGAVTLPILGQATHQHQHGTPLSTKVPPYQAKVFNAADLALFATLTSIIIPKTDTPGAAEAGVPLLIDGSCSRNATLAASWQATLAWFRTQGPDAETTIARIAQEKDTAGARHFKLLKDQTIDHYYATQAGLQQELGWNANTYLTEFSGCTHPEHKA